MELGRDSDKLCKNSYLSEKGTAIFKISLFILSMVFIFYPPYVRGLYFEEDQLSAGIVVFLIFATFWAYKILKRDKYFLKTPLEYAALSFSSVYFLPVVMYLIGINIAVSPHLALIEWIKYCMYVAVFFMLTELVDNFKFRTVSLNVMLASALGVCIIGYDGATGEHIAKFLNAGLSYFGSDIKIFDTYVWERIFSTLQYPNALAAYLMAVFFVCLSLGMAIENWFIKAVYGGMGFLIFNTFIYTKSRGALAIFPIILLIYWASLPRGSKTKGMIYCAIPLTVEGIGLLMYPNYISNSAGSWEYVFLRTIAGILLSAILTAGICFLIKIISNFFRDKQGVKIINKNSHRIIIGSCGIVLIFLIFGALNISQPKYLNYTNGSSTATRIGFLREGKDYILRYNIKTDTKELNKDAYTLKIANKTERDIVSEQQTETILALVNGRSAETEETKEVSFKVPDKSKYVYFEYANVLQGSSLTLGDVKIIDNETGKLYKKVVFKYKFIPDKIVAMYEDYLTAKSGLERTIFYRDGFNMFKARPILGAGGGAWPQLYFSYQSYLYWTMQAHNYILQLVLETGIIGLLVFLYMLISIVALFLNDKKREKNASDQRDRIIQGGMLAGILALIMHSAIDFDLSLSAVCLLLWQLIAVFNSRYRENLVSTSVEHSSRDGSIKFFKLFEKIKIFTNVKKGSIRPALGLSFSIALIILLISYNSAETVSKIARNKAGDDLDKAIDYMKIASDRAPTKPEYRLNYIKYSIDKISQKKTNNVRGILKEVKKAESLSFYNVNLVSQVARDYFKLEDIEKGLETCERMTFLRPMRDEEWNLRLDATHNTTLYYLKKNNLNEAFKIAGSTSRIVDDMTLLNKGKIIPVILNNRGFELLEKIWYLKDNEEYIRNIAKDKINLYDYVKGEYLEKVLFYNILNIDVDKDGICDQWKIGDGYIESRGLNIVPGERYKIELVLDDKYNGDRISYSIEGINGEGGFLVKDGDVNTGGFYVPNNIKPDYNPIRLGIKVPKDIKTLKIIKM